MVDKRIKNKTMMKILVHKIIGLSMLLMTLLSCQELVEDGYRTEYNESSAQLYVSTVGYGTGAINDTVRFLIQAKSDYDINSIIVTSSISGGGGSGFVVPDNNVDPLIDHSFGTVQENIKEFSLYYNYIVTQDTADPVITFKLIDEEGQRTMKQTVVTLYSVARYKNISLFFQSSSKTDGLSTQDSEKYRDLSQYVIETDENKAIQKSIDIIFVIESNAAWIIAPKDWRFSATETFIKNKTRFLLIPDVSSEEFNLINSSEIHNIVVSDSVKQKGTTGVQVQLGSVVCFFTDYGSTNSYKAGVLRVKAIHPSYCDWYSGETYQLDMDIVTQISK